MTAYVVLLATGESVTHEGKPDTKYGVLTFSTDVFRFPFVAYAPGRWLEFVEVEEEKQ